jgi:hypothetical protein
LWSRVLKNERRRIPKWAAAASLAITARTTTTKSNCRQIDKSKTSNCKWKENIATKSSKYATWCRGKAEALVFFKNCRPGMVIFFNEPIYPPYLQLKCRFNYQRTTTLSIVAQQLKGNIYQSVAHCANDIRIIFRNCMIFVKKSPSYQYAASKSAHFEEEYRELEKECKFFGDT